VAWGWWLFIVFGVLALVRLVRGRLRLAAEHRPAATPAEWLDTYGPLMLVAGLLIAYALAGALTRWFIIILLVAVTAGPYVVTLVERFGDRERAHTARMIVFLVVAACAGALILSFVVRLVLVLLAMVAIVVVLGLAAVLLGLVGRRS
jgi:hypothetical protein